MTNTGKNIPLTDEEMTATAGGHPFEESFGDAALYRAGITYVNCVFGADEYWIGSTRISKDQAKMFRALSTKLWNDNFKDTADLVGFIRAWKNILQVDYGISWDGILGKYRASFS